jgi:hypothetical protein
MPLEGSTIFGLVGDQYGGPAISQLAQFVTPDGMERDAGVIIADTYIGLPLDVPSAIVDPVGALIILPCQRYNLTVIVAPPLIFM